MPVPTLRYTALAALLGALGACADAPQSGDALETAGEALGGGVLAAERFRAGGTDWIAALRGAAAVGLVDSLTAEPVSRNAHQVVLLRRAGTRWEPLTPGLYAQADSADARWGLADVDEDGSPDVWAARAANGRIDLRAYATGTGVLYRLVVPLGSGGPDPAQREFSFNVMERPGVQAWLTARAESVARGRRR